MFAFAMLYSSSALSFFFQAEDGIRDTSVTGVQTCALPISANRMRVNHVGAVSAGVKRHGRKSPGVGFCPEEVAILLLNRKRSEERRVGKECRSRWSQNRENKQGS